jgi:hypothetical protein
MRAALIVLFATIGLGFVWAGASAQQEVRPTPGPGSGMMFVQGTVDITNVPTVMATQSGEWRVALSSVPPAMMSGPDFLAPGGRYTIYWSAGESETVTIVAAGQGGWAQVEYAAGKGARRWVNFGAAISVHETQ